jgi:hypothetical protein
MAFTATQVIDELTAAFEAAKRITDAWRAERAKELAGAIGYQLSDQSVHPELTRILYRMIESAGAAQSSAWQAKEYVEWAAQEIKARRATESNFTV